VTGPAASWLVRLGGSLSSTPAVAGIVVVGLVAGWLGAMSAGALDGGADGPSEVLPLFACPDGQSQVGEVQPGEQVLVTARSQDGAWLAVHFPDGALGRAWAERAAFTLESDAGSLPVAGCDAATAPSFPVAGSTFTITANFSPSPPPTHRPTATPEPTASPTAAPTATPRTSPAPAPTSGPMPTVSPGPSPSPTPPPTPTPTAPPTPTAAPTPDTTGPVLTNLVQSVDLIYVFGGSCVPEWVTISVDAADPGTVFSATVWYSPPNGSWFSKPMGLVAGSSLDGTWAATIYTDMGWLAGDMQYYVVARDYPRNSSKLPGSGYPHVSVTYCGV